jgi:hypothetical protein
MRVSKLISKKLKANLLISTLAATVLLLYLNSCADSGFKAGAVRKSTQTPKTADEEKVPNPENDEDIGGPIDGPKIPPEFQNLPPTDLSSADGKSEFKKCSLDYTVPGKANIWLAGTDSGASISYKNSISYKKVKPDRMPSEAPVQVVPSTAACLQEKGFLYFTVSGQISHENGANPTNADGKVAEIATHQRGAVFGKSDISAPFNSLVGVFLGDSLGTAPEALNFSSSANLSPKLGQVFFVGDGLDASKVAQGFKIPAGTKRLYLGIMDSYEWNNNTGSLTGGIAVKAK